MKYIRNVAFSYFYIHGRLPFILLLFLLLSVTTGCDSYRPTSTIEGRFYPNGKVKFEGRKANLFLPPSTIELTIQQPVRVSELGVMTYGWEVRQPGWSAEVGRLEFSDTDVYIVTQRLRDYGRFEYRERKSTAYDWTRNHPYSFALFAILVIIAVVIIVMIFNWLRAEAEKERQAEEEKRIREEQLRKEKEIERRKNIVLDIVNNLYKEAEKEVNKTLIPTLINELYDIYTGLHSDNMDYLVINGSLKDFQNIINSIRSELNRLKNLALEAQSKGFTDDEKDYTYSNENDGKMSKERAFDIFGIKSSATKEEIKKAHRDMVKKYNTDQRSHLEEHIKKMLEDKMKELNSAKDYLSTLGLM